MKPKTILVTGANSGIGYQTALALARQGYHVIMHGRNEQKVKKALEEIKEQSGNENIDSVIADLSLMAEVKKLAEKIKDRYDHLDGLINNASTQMGNVRVETAEGHEKTMATNVFSPLLLTTLLIPLLSKSADGRIITVSSASYNQGTSDRYLDDIELKNNYEFSRAYGLSKLYVLWTMWHLENQLRQKGINNVTINCMEPGSAYSNLGSESLNQRPIWMKALVAVWEKLPLTKDPKIPGTTNALLATSNEFRGLTGKFFDFEGRIEKENREYYSPQNDQRLWDYCMTICEPFLSEAL